MEERFRHEAVSQVTRMRPDVLLLDLHMPGINGDEVTRRLIRDVPAVRICVLTMFAPAVASRLHAYFSAVHVASVPFPSLAPREREVLELMAQGLENQRIADSLGLSTKTVRNVASNIFAILGVAQRSGAIIAARNAGMGRPSHGKASG